MCAFDHVNDIAALRERPFPLVNCKVFKHCLMVFMLPL